MYKAYKAAECEEYMTQQTQIQQEQLAREAAELSRENERETAQKENRLQGSNRLAGRGQNQEKHNYSEPL